MKVGQGETGRGGRLKLKNLSEECVYFPEQHNLIHLSFLQPPACVAFLLQF